MALKELVAGLYKEQNKVQNLLSSLGFALRSFKNVDQVLELAPLIASRATGANGGFLLLFDADGLIRSDINYGHNLDKFSKVRQALKKVIRQANLAISNNKIVEPEISTNIDSILKQSLNQFTRLYGTPILLDNVEKGRIYVFSNHAEYSWTQTRRKLLQLVADQAAVAISNHELSLNLRDRLRQDKEIEIASQIQRRLLPTHYPSVKGLKIAANSNSAHRVGGDYYDFIPINYDLHPTDNDEINSNVPLGIVIGDVMGKGISAGLIMTMTRGMLRAEVLNRHTPAKILEHLNQVMYADLDSANRFVTLFYSEFEPVTKTLRYSNAAHNPPLLWRSSSESLLRLDTAGTVIGLASNSQYENAQIQLISGDTLLYYTDGITDAVNQQEKRFEEGGLIEILEKSCRQKKQPQEILDNLLEEMNKFIGPNNEDKDDMTVVVIQIE